MSAAAAEKKILDSRSCAGCRCTPPRSYATISAQAPTRISPQSVRPCASAPNRHAIRSSSPGPKRLESPETPFCSSPASRVSSSMSRLLLLAAPSVPMPTRMPRSRQRAMLAMPDPSLRLLEGQCATVTPLSAKMSRSDSSTQTQCAAVVGLSNRPQSARKAAGVLPPRRALHSSCSLRVSEMCTCMRMPFPAHHSASSRTARSSRVVYSACRLASATSLPSGIRAAAWRVKSVPRRALLSRKLSPGRACEKPCERLALMPLSSTARTIPGMCMYMSVNDTVPDAIISAMPARAPQ